MLRSLVTSKTKFNEENKKKCQINDLSVTELNIAGQGSGKKIKDFLKIEKSINNKKSSGSTSVNEVRKAINIAKKEF